MTVTVIRSSLGWLDAGSPRRMRFGLRAWSAGLSCLAAIPFATNNNRPAHGMPGSRRIVLFVCTSNTCRSPMAEAIAKRWFAQRCGCSVDKLTSAHGWDIRSGALTDEVSQVAGAARAAAVFARARMCRCLARAALTRMVRCLAQYEKPGSPASANSITAMARSGMDLTSHRSTLLTPDAVREAHAILCVSQRHVQWILRMVPEAAGKTRTLGADIPDPWHQEQAAYDLVAETMLRVVPEACKQQFGHHFDAEGC